MVRIPIDHSFTEKSWTNIGGGSYLCLRKETTKNIPLHFGNLIKFIYKKRNCQVVFPEIEEAIVIWLSHACISNLTVTNGVLKKKALDFRDLLQINNFTASDEEECVKLKDIIRQYDLNNVFNADKTALYWELEPSKTLAIGPVVDASIINSFKAQYRKRLVKNRVDAYDDTINNNKKEINKLYFSEPISAMEFVNIDNEVSEEFSDAEIIETVCPSQNNEVAEDEDEGIEFEPSIPVKNALEYSENILSFLKNPPLNFLTT
nr:10152_t:CDS:2 [Entrophospora candida]